MPSEQPPKQKRGPKGGVKHKPGRDHDWHGYSMWLAGAGVKGGQAIGATDELGFKAVEEPHHVEAELEVLGHPPQHHRAVLARLVQWPEVRRRAGLPARPCPGRGVP